MFWEIRGEKQALETMHVGYVCLWLKLQRRLKLNFPLIQLTGPIQSTGPLGALFLELRRLLNVASLQCIFHQVGAAVVPIVPSCTL